MSSANTLSASTTGYEEQVELSLLSIKPPSSSVLPHCDADVNRLIAPPAGAPDTLASNFECSPDSAIEDYASSTHVDVPRQQCDPDLEAEATSLGNERAQQLGKRIDMLLVFIGMLLGVTTSLLMNAANSLRPSPSAAIVPILQQFLVQLHGFESNSYPTPEGFIPDRLIILVNSLYAVGIVLCLAVGFGGTCVKLQLPGELDTSTLVSWRSRERVLRVSVDALLGLAALAFLLFLIGLSIDKIRLNMAIGLVAMCTTGFVILVLLLFALLSWRYLASTHQALDV